MSARHRRPGEGDGVAAPSRFSLRTIRGKLAMIVAIPSVLLIALVGVGVVAQFRASQEADAITDNVELVLAAQELIHSLQKERGLTNGLLGGRTEYRADVNGQRLLSDEARARLDTLMTEEAVPGVPAVRTALDRLGSLAVVRGSVDAGQAVRADVFAFYTTAIYALSDAPYDTDAREADAAIQRGLTALRELGRAKEAMAQERGHLNGVFAAGAFTPAEYVKFAELRATKADALAQFTGLATPGQISALGAAQRSQAATTAAALEQQAVTGARGRPLGVNARTWWDAMTTVVDGLRTVQRGVGEDLSALAKAGKDDATRLLITLLVLAGVIVLGALLLAAITSRSIIKPLRQLTGEANDVAEHRLPEAVARLQAADDPHDVLTALDSVLAHRRDEFAEVANALVNVHHTAVRLASEQAVLRRNTAESLANLGRRNQNLVRRQLGFISALEQEESDPNALANLFELDHLATRMRRNAESLLVLVGEQSPRRQAEPVSIGDVLRSALSEVEDYRRVVLRRVDDALVRGAVVAEVAHLLAELIENALVYSPPDQDVEIQARGNASQYHIAIVDQGVGITPEELEIANARLRGERSFLVAPARYLGHYVVGQLAGRLGVKVWLHDSPLAGITARVVLPPELMTGRPRPEPELVPEMLMVGTAPIPAISLAAATPPGPLPVAVLDGPAPVSMTPNGLVRRVPRARRQDTPAPVYGGPADMRADRSRDVRAMLNDFRSGVRRGAQDRDTQEN